MRKLALALAVTFVLALWGNPAHARCRSDCPAWLDALGYSLGTAVVGGYAYGTGYMIHRDLTGDRQTLEYAGAEIGINAAFAALFTVGTADAIKNRKPGQTAVWGALTLTHATLAAHGVRTAYRHRDELRPEPRTAARFAALAYATNAVIWGLQLPGDHGRGYGIAEAAVNAPLAAGLGYLAIDRARGGDNDKAALFGGMAALSAGLALHGAYTAIFHKARHDEPIDFGLDLGLGADVAPTIVTDGKEIAPGLGASGTW